MSGHTWSGEGCAAHLAVIALALVASVWRLTRKADR